EQPGGQVRAQLVAFGRGQDLPLPGAVDRGELVRDPHHVGGVDGEFPVDPLAGVPLLVLAPLVQVEQPPPAAVVLPGEAGGTRRRNVPVPRGYWGCVTVVRAHGRLPGGGARILLASIPRPVGANRPGVTGRPTARGRRGRPARAGRWSGPRRSARAGRTAARPAWRRSGSR